MTTKRKRVYPFAVLRTLDPEDQRQSPWSCHMTAAAAAAEARRMSKQEATPGAYIAVHWGAQRWASEFWPCCQEVEEVSR